MNKWSSGEAGERALEEYRAMWKQSHVHLKLNWDEKEYDRAAQHQKNHKITVGIQVHIVWKWFPLLKVVKAAESPLAESLKAGEKQGKEGWKDMCLYDNADCNYSFSTPQNTRASPRKLAAMQAGWCVVVAKICDQREPWRHSEQCEGSRGAKNIHA